MFISVLKWGTALPSLAPKVPGKPRRTGRRDGEGARVVWVAFGGSRGQWPGRHYERSLGRTGGAGVREEAETGGGAGGEELCLVGAGRGGGGLGPSAAPRGPRFGLGYGV